MIDKEYTDKDFADDFNRLVDEKGYTIVAYPEYMRRDDGTFSTIIKYTIEKVIKPTNNTLDNKIKKV